MDGLNFQTHTVYRDRQSGSLLLMIHHNPMALSSLVLTPDGSGGFDAAHPRRADVDTIIANEEDFQKALGLKAESAASVESGELNVDQYRAIAALAMEKYPNVQRVAITLRESKSANHNDWRACLYNGKDFFLSRKYAITDIVDRVGGGDSFGGGLIYGLNTYGDEQQALEFAVAASCLKHTIPGDYNRVSVSEVESLMKGSGSGRVQR